MNQRTCMYYIFVSLGKAYNKVNGLELWNSLNEYGSKINY